MTSLPVIAPHHSLITPYEATSVLLSHTNPVLDPPPGHQENANNLEDVFAENLRTIGNMVALVDKWEDPVYCTRMWTVFEQYTATRLRVPVSMILPPAQDKSFHRQLTTGKMMHVIESLTTIDVEKAKANPADEEKLRTLIQSTVG